MEGISDFSLIVPVDGIEINPQKPRESFSLREFPYCLNTRTQILSKDHMQASKRLTLTFCLALALLVVSPSILYAHAITPYIPNVTVGQFAQYKVLKDACQSTVPQVCQALKISLNDTTYAAIKVVAVSGTAVTLGLISIYKNGTGSQVGALVDVASGSSNITAFSSLSGDFFVLAGNLQAGNQLWSTSSPTFNTTSTESILGMPRSVNFLNFTGSGTTMGTSFTESAGFAYDGLSGVLIEVNFSIKIAIATTELDFGLGMVDNNIWGTASLPDFSLTPSPATVNISGTATGTSTITLTRSNSFTATVKLTANPSSPSITCSLSSTSLSNGGSDTSTLSCSGSPGTYAITIDGNGGYSTHDTSVVVNIASGSNPGFTISNNGPLNFQTGSSGTATITITAQNGYSSTTNLEITSTPTGLTCNLSNNSVSGHGMSALTCSGPPGSYTVTIKATGGGTSHSTQTAVTVSAAPTTTQPAAGLSTPVIYAGIGVAALAVAAILALLFLRRRPGGTTDSTGDASAPAPQV